jgi:hypothetical protein
LGIYSEEQEEKTKRSRGNKYFTKNKMPSAKLMVQNEEIKEGLT